MYPSAMMPVSRVTTATTAVKAATAAIAASMVEATKVVRVRQATRARRSPLAEPASINITPIQPPTRTTFDPKPGGLV